MFMDNKAFHKQIGMRITQRRKQRNMTQEELAELVDVTPQMISSAELGKKGLRPENLYKISKALNVSADYLLSGEVTRTDAAYLQTRMKNLTPKKFRCIEKIIDNCIQLSLETSD